MPGLVRQRADLDALFRSDPVWRGSDDAYSIDLGGGRILWLFGDTFISGDGSGRPGSKMIRNAIGIQTGRDPSTAHMSFAWGKDTGAFFESGDDSWYWPGDGTLVGGEVLVFLMRMRRGKGTGVLDGFRADGWQAVRIHNPAADPASWRLDYIESPQHRDAIVAGSGGVLVYDGHLYAYSCGDRGRVYLVRWEEGTDLRAPQWWTSKGWSRDGEAVPVFEQGHTEFSVHFQNGRFVEVQGTQLDDAWLAVRTAPEPQGPWTALRPLFQPCEASRPDVFLYAFKAHPELDAGGLLCTYAQNSFDFKTLLSDESIYYPRFVEVDPAALDGP